MVRKGIVILACVIAAGFQLEAKQDFERSYALITGRHVTINNVMGDISVSGYKGETIKVIAKSEGPDSDTIRIVENNFGPRVELFPVSSKFNSSKTKLDFEVKVPKSEKNVSIELKSGSGKIEATDISGTLIVTSFRGDIKVENIQGNLFAHSISGNLDATIKEAQGMRWMKLDSGSGNIKVTAPSNLEGWISMSTSGTLNTDFAIDKHQSRYGGKVARGKLGSGTQRIEISSVFGSVSLLKK